MLKSPAGSATSAPKARASSKRGYSSKKSHGLEKKQQRHSTRDTGAPRIVEQTMLDLLQFDHSSNDFDEIQLNLEYELTAAQGLVAYTDFGTARINRRAFDVAIRRYNEYTSVGSGKEAHRDWFSNAKWCALYQVGHRQVHYVQGTQSVTKQEASVPCHHCGLVLPLGTNIQGDHVHPRHKGKADQSGAGHTRAIAKLMRVLGAGYTMGRPTGARGVAVRSERFEPIAPMRPSFGANQMMRSAKYNLSLRGKLLMSYIIDAVENSQRDTFRNKCMNSFVNVVPLCPACNGAGGKGRKVRALPNIYGVD